MSRGIKSQLEEATTGHGWDRLSFNNDGNCTREKLIKYL